MGKQSALDALAIMELALKNCTNIIEDEFGYRAYPDKDIEKWSRKIKKELGNNG